MKKVALFAAASVVCALASSSQHASASDAEVRFGPHDVASVLAIAKSENRNEVHFAVALDERCRPVGDAPVRAYWKMREKGDSLEPLLDREQAAYGVARQRVDGPRVHLSLRAKPEWGLVVEASQRGGACEAHTVAAIAGRPIELSRIFVQLAFPFGVAWTRATGRSLGDGAAVEARL
jgi:hypothetical protein